VSAVSQLHLAELEAQAALDRAWTAHEAMKSQHEVALAHAATLTQHVTYAHRDAANLAGALVVTQAAVDTAAQALKAAVLALAEAQAAEAQAHLEVLRNG